MRRAGQKSTVASYVAVGLPKAGQRVATIDPDARQQSLTRYVNNRRASAAHTGLDLEVPAHFCIEQGRAMQIADNEELECQRLIDAVNAVDRNVDFIVVDTPGTDSYLSRLAHSTADHLITPMNDSLLDFDVLGSVDPTTPQQMLGPEWSRIPSAWASRWTAAPSCVTCGGSLSSP